MAMVHAGFSPEVEPTPRRLATALTITCSTSHSSRHAFYDSRLKHTPLIFTPWSSLLTFNLCSCIATSQWLLSKYINALGTPNFRVWRARLDSRHLSYRPQHHGLQYRPFGPRSWLCRRPWFRHGFCHFHGKRLQQLASADYHLAYAALYRSLSRISSRSSTMRYRPRRCSLLPAEP